MSSSGAGSLLLGIGGAFIGGFVGMPALGFAVGSSLGSALFPGQLPTVEGPRLDDTSVMSSAYGQPIPKVYGTCRVGGNLIWSSGITEHANETTVGGKGGPEQTQVQYSYTASFAVALCEGPVRGIGRIWADGKVISNNRFDLMEDQLGAGTDSLFRFVVDTVVGVFRQIGGSYYTIYRGTETQTPDPTIEAYEGSNNAPAYRGLCYIVFNEMPLAKFGNRIPSITAEVMSEGTSTQDQITKIRDQTNENPYQFDTNSNYDGAPMCQFRFEDRIEVITYDRNELKYMMWVFDVAGKFISKYDCRDYGAYHDTFFTSSYSEYGTTWYFMDKMYFPEKDEYLRVSGDTSGRPWQDGLIPSTGTYPTISASSVSTYAYVRLGNYIAGYPGESARNILEDFASLEAGKYFHGIIFDPTKIYCMLFFGDGEADHGSSVQETKRWYLCRIKDRYYMDILDNGTVDHTGGLSAFNEFMFGKRDWFYQGALDRDLRTIWYKYSAGTHECTVYRINPLTKVASVVDTTTNYITTGNFYNEVISLDSGVCTFLSDDDIIVATIVDTGDHEAATLGGIVKDVCTSVGISLSDIDTTDIDAITVDGVKIDREMTARAIIELLQRAYFFDAAESDFNLKFVLRSAVTPEAIDSGDLVETLKVTRSEDTALPLKVIVKYNNMNANHQVNAQQAKRIE